MAEAPRHLLHVDLISLLPGTGEAVRREVVAAAEGLKAIEGVLAAGVIDGQPGSDADLLTFFLLPDLARLEAFGTDPRYTSFLQKTIAPVLLGLSGADVELQSPFPEGAATAACLVVAARDTTYDWQIKADLGGWAAGVAVGLAVGDRQRYRGLAIFFSNNLPAPLPAAPLGYGALVVAGPAQRFG
jgi:hypothetical protein